MPIVAADLVLQGSANRPEDDTSTVGGARVATARPLDSQFAAAAIPHIVSDNAGDTTQTVRIIGRDAAGGILDETETLNGLTEVSFTGTYERILRAVKSATTTGSVEIRQGSGGTVRHTFAPSELDCFIHFQRSASEAGATTRYEKDFWLNNHGSLTLTAATVELTADPGSNIRTGLAATVDDTATATNRETAPGGITFTDDGVADAVPSNQLAAGEAIGMWVEMQLSGAQAAGLDTFTTELAGTTV